MDESRAGGQNLTPARAMLKEQADAAGIWLHPRVWLVAPDEAEAIDRELLENQRTFTSGDSDQRLRGFIESQGLEITVRTPVRFVAAAVEPAPPPAPRPAVTPTRRKYRE